VLVRAARAPLALALAVAAVAVSLYVVAYPMAVVRYPPITDLPFHGAATSILRHYFDPSWHFREQFELQIIQVPYLTLYALGALFSFVMPIVWATKLATVVLLLLLPAGLSVMFHGMRKSPLLGLLGLAFVWNTLTHWGFINFMAAIGLLGMVIGFTLLVLDRPTRGRRVGLAASLLLVFFSHIFRFPFALAAVAVTTVAMLPATRRVRPVLAPVLPALAALGVWLAVRQKELSGGGIGPLRPQLERLRQVPGFLFGGFVGPDEQLLAERAYWVYGAVALVCLASFVAERRRRRWRKGGGWWAVGSTVAVAGVAAACL
jgi:hypothetical protein